VPSELDLLTASPPAEPRVFSVSEITRAVRTVLEESFGESVWVEGEISNYRKQPSGHQYFTLKDAGAQLACVLFARGAWRRTIALQDGMQVRARGQLTVYEARGQYQLNVQHVEAAGAGLLQAKFEALKRKLQAEGLFDAERKRPLPRFPATVALITSPSGAALRDMLNIFTRRAPWLRVVIVPARVQGDGAAAELRAALDTLHKLDTPRPDVIVLTRGGGSTEDLWEFNDETLARAIVASSIPVVSAVGHEIDFTICDFAADLRAPTPSAAAELIAPDGAELARHLAHLTQRLKRESRTQLDTAQQRLDLTSESLNRAAYDRLAALRAWLAERVAALREHRPDQVLRLRRSALAALIVRLAERFTRAFDQRRQRLQRAADHLRLLSPQATLSRGYTITTHTDGSVVASAAAVKPGDRLRTRTANGEFDSIASKSL
jgi:exodeoxyribonuclease VII large subunit